MSEQFHHEVPKLPKPGEHTPDHTEQGYAKDQAQKLKLAERVLEGLLKLDT